MRHVVNSDPRYFSIIVEPPSPLFGHDLYPHYEPRLTEAVEWFLNSQDQYDGKRAFSFTVPYTQPQIIPRLLRWARVHFIAEKHDHLVYKIEVCPERLAVFVTYNYQQLPTSEINFYELDEGLIAEAIPISMLKRVKLP